MTGRAAETIGRRFVTLKEQPMTLKLTVEHIAHGEPMPDRSVLCVSAGQDGGNLSPALSWTGVPKDAKSLALLMIDKDSPIDHGNRNKTDKRIPADAPRRDFYHWLAVDIPADATGVAEGGDTGGIKGMNSFGSPSRNGYDGPCPAWNDELRHRYYFILRALDVPSLGLADGFRPQDAEAAMEGHVLAEASVMSTYTTNPDLRAAAASKPSPICPTTAADSVS